MSYMGGVCALDNGSSAPDRRCDNTYMVFYRHVMDRTLHRAADHYSPSEVLWPDGRWVADPELDRIHYAMPIDEKDAQAFADAYCGRPVGLCSPRYRRRNRDK